MTWGAAIVAVDAQCEGLPLSPSMYDVGGCHCCRRCTTWGAAVVIVVAQPGGSRVVDAWCVAPLVMVNMGAVVGAWLLLSSGLSTGTGLLLLLSASWGAAIVVLVLVFVGTPTFLVRGGAMVDVGSWSQPSLGSVSICEGRGASSMHDVGCRPRRHALVVVEDHNQR